MNWKSIINKVFKYKSEELTPTVEELNSAEAQYESEINQEYNKWQITNMKEIDDYSIETKQPETISLQQNKPKRKYVHKL